MNWVDGLKQAYDNINFKLSQRSFEMLEQQWKHYGKFFDLQLTEFCEFAWLYNFGVRFSLIRDSTPLQFIKTQNFHRFHAFFGDYLFQCWALSNFDNLKRYNEMFDNVHYKMPVKQYTNSVINDDQCLYVGKHMSNIIAHKDRDFISVRETDRYVVYDIGNAANYQIAGNAIANIYRKHPIL